MYKANGPHAQYGLSQLHSNSSYSALAISNYLLGSWLLKVKTGGFQITDSIVLQYATPKLKQLDIVGACHHQTGIIFFRILSMSSLKISIQLFPPRVRTLGAAPLCFRGFPWSFPIKKVTSPLLQFVT